MAIKLRLRALVTWSDKSFSVFLAGDHLTVLLYWFTHISNDRLCCISPTLLKEYSNTKLGRLLH